MATAIYVVATRLLVVHLPTERPELGQRAPARTRFPARRLNAEELSLAFASRVLLKVAPVDSRHTFEPEGVEDVPVVADELVSQVQAGVDEALATFAAMARRLRHGPGVDVTAAEGPVDGPLLLPRDLRLEIEREGHDAGRQAAEWNRCVRRTDPLQLQRGRRVKEVTRRSFAGDRHRVDEQLPPVGRDRLDAAVTHDERLVADGTVHGADATLGSPTGTTVELGHDSTRFPRGQKMRKHTVSSVCLCVYYIRFLTNSRYLCSQGIYHRSDV